MLTSRGTPAAVSGVLQTLSYIYRPARGLAGRARPGVITAEVAQGASHRSHRR